MAELGLIFSDLYNEVLKFLGTYNSGSPGATDLTDAKFIVNRAYARFTSYYDWTFLSQRQTLETDSTKWVYELDRSFSYFIYPYLHFSDDDGYPSVEQRTPGFLQSLRADGTESGYPLYFALQAGPYNVYTGQAWEVQLFPTPDSTYRLWYYAKINPQKLENDGDIPIGGADMSDCLLSLCLAYAEEYKDERKAIRAEVVDAILGPAKQMDVRRKTSILGYLGPIPKPQIGDSTHGGTILISSAS